MDAPTARNTAISARDERSVVAFPSERRLTPRSDRGFASRSTGSADRVRHYAACMVTKIRATKRVFRWPVDSQAPIYPVMRAKVGFRCEFEGSPAARADDAAAWANRRRAKQLARRAIDTTALGAADPGSVRWGVIVRRKRASAQDRLKKDARPLCGRPTAEAAEQGLGAVEQFPSGPFRSMGPGPRRAFLGTGLPQK
jgi:hypothetical protein